MEFPKLSIGAIAEPCHDGCEQFSIVNLQRDLVGKRLDAGVLERVQCLSDCAHVIHPPQRVRIVQIIGRPTIIQPEGLIARLDTPQDRIDRFSFVIS